MWSRRTALRAAMGVMGASLLAACAPAPAPAPTTAPAPAAKPTEPPKPAATTAPAAAPTTAPAAAPTTPPAKPAATTAPAAAGAAPSGTLRIGNADFGNESMDPIVIDSAWGMAMYDSLLTFSPRGDVVGRVAERYEVSPDGLTWTFHIRKGIKFHNGDPLTAQDVVFSLNRFGSKESTNPWSPYILRNAESITARDDDTVVYKATKPEWSLKVPFAWTRILPKNYFESVGQDGFRAKPIGSGPYKFANWTPRTSMEFEANADYWGPIKPSYARIVETLVPEESTRIAQLERGEQDIINAVTFDRLVDLRNKGFRLEEVAIPTATNISFPGHFMTTGPTSDIKVRQAMSAAINRQEIIDTFYKGFGKPGGWWFFSEQTFGFDPNRFKSDPFDPARARQLLQEAGYPGKFTPQSITVFATATQADLMQILQGYWQNVGIQTEIEVLDTAAWFGLIFVRPKEPTEKAVGSIWAWSAGSFYNNVYHSANMFGSMGVHGTSNDTRADQMYEAAIREVDENKAKQLWSDFMAYAYETMWVNVPLVNVPVFVVVGPNVGDIGQQTKHLPFLSDGYVGIQRKA